MQMGRYFCDRCKKEIFHPSDVEHGKLKIPSYELCHDCYSEFKEAERKAQSVYRKVINNWLKEGDKKNG